MELGKTLATSVRGHILKGRSKADGDAAAADPKLSPLNPSTAALLDLYLADELPENPEEWRSGPEALHHHSPSPLAFLTGIGKSVGGVAVGVGRGGGGVAVGVGRGVGGVAVGVGRGVGGVASGVAGAARRRIERKQKDGPGQEQTKEETGEGVA